MTQLERECDSYTRYLIGQAPTPYVIEKYRDFHQKMGIAVSGDRFERFLVSTSARGPVWARLTACYASVWRKHSSVRKKLAVTLALLECTPPAFEHLDKIPRGGFPGVILSLAVDATGYVCGLLAAATLFGPIHFWMTKGER